MAINTNLNSVAHRAFQGVMRSRIEKNRWLASYAVLTQRELRMSQDRICSRSY